MAFSPLEGRNESWTPRVTSSKLMKSIQSTDAGMVASTNIKCSQGVAKQWDMAFWVQ